MLEGHTFWVHAVAISADGSKIVSGGEDKTVRVWSMETGQVVLCIVSPSIFDLCAHYCAVSGNQGA